MLLFPPQTWVWVWLGNQVGGGRLRAMEHREIYRNRNIVRWVGVALGLGERLEDSAGMGESGGMVP